MGETLDSILGDGPSLDDLLKPKPVKSGSRTDRNNNPIASSIALHPDGTINTNDATTAEWTGALKNAGVPFTAGDSFGGNRGTINFPDINTGVKGADALLRTSAFNWYKNQTGKEALASVDSPAAYAALPEAQRLAIIHGIYKHEDVNGKLQLPSTINGSEQALPTPAATPSLDDILGKQQASPLVNIPGFPYISGAASSVANIPASIMQAFNRPSMASGLPNVGITNQQAPTTDQLNQLRSAGLHEGDNGGGLGGVLKGVWNSTLGFVNNQLQTIADQARGNPIEQGLLSGIPGMNYYMLAADTHPAMTDAQRFQAGAQFAQTAIAAGAGYIAGKGGSLNTATDFASIPEAMATLPISSQAEIIQRASSNTLGNVINHGVQAGISAGVTMSLAEAHANGDDVLNGAYNYGLAGGLLGGVGARVFGGKATSDTKVAALKQNLAQTIAQNFSNGDAAVAFADDLTKGVDIVKNYKDKLDGDPKVITGLPTLEPSNMTDSSIGRYRNPDGSYDVIVQAPAVEGSTPTISDEQLKQFNEEGYISGETVTKDGSDYIYDGMNPKSGLLKLRNIATDGVSYATRESVYRPNQFRLGDTETPTIDYEADKARLMESLAPADRAIIENNILSSALRSAQKSENTAHSLVANGYYADPSTNGYIIKSFSDPSFEAPIKNIDDARQFLLDDMKTPNSADLTKDIQGKLVPELNGLQLSGNRSLTVPINGEVGLIRRTFDRANTVANFAVSINNLVASITRQTGFNPLMIKLGQGLTKMFDAVKQVESIRNSYVARAKATFGPILDGDATVKNLIHKHMTTFSVDEFNNEGLRGVAPSSQTMGYAQQMIDAGTDTADRQVANQYAINKARFDAQLKSGVGDDGKPFTQAMYDTTMEKMGQQINDGNPITPEQLKAVDIINQAHLDPAADHLETLVGADVLQHPDRFLSQDEFAKANNMTDAQIGASRQASLFYQALSKEFNIESPLTRYAPVMRQYMGSGILDIDKMNNYKFAPPQEIQFVHALARLGFTDPDAVITDPAMLFSRYLNNGLRVKYLEPLLQEMKGQLQELQSSNIDGKLPVAALSKIGMHLDDQVRGYSNPLDRLGEVATPEQMGLLTGDVATAQKLANLWTKWQAFKGIGFRPMIGMRHLGAVVQTVAMQFGAGFAKDFVSNMAKGFQLGDDLQSAGTTPSTNLANTLGTVNRTFNNTSIGRPLQAAANVGGNIADASFRMTGLPEVYKVMHATAYLTATQRIGSALIDYSRGELTPEAFAKKVNVDLYSPADQATFKSLVENGSYEQATDFLARRTGEMSVGNFARINNPMMYGSAKGRVLGQFGQWKLWELQNIADAVSSTDKITKMRRMAYLMGASTVATGASAALGINLYNWSLYDSKHLWDWLGDPSLPEKNVMENLIGGAIVEAKSNLLPNQSPALRLLSLMDDAGSTSRTAAYSKTLIGQQLSPLPVPAEFNDAIEAVQRMDNGDPFPVWAYKLMGGQVNTDQYKKPSFSLWDY